MQENHLMSATLSTFKGLILMIYRGLDRGERDRSRGRQRATEREKKRGEEKREEDRERFGDQCAQGVGLVIFQGFPEG